ncbi:MAG: tRNA lysidine(34) synthetase TilS [Acidobacteria bacterium]|nr:tRNA lysidine(34) synthetase TilS [Acidobacteriota bacterium]
MYHGAVHSLAQTVLAHIRREGLLKPGNGVAVAVSGGADSVALLRLLLEARLELGIVLSVAHFNHQLRGAEADADEQFVRALAGRHDLEFHGGRGDVAAYATEKSLSLEAAARALRYDFFRRLLRENSLTQIATAHTLDDQAETVLLRLARGTGTRGLAGIYPRLAVEQAAIIRPLLSIRRQELEAYLTKLGQDWREDSSNRDLQHARNRVRHGLLPGMEQNLNPAVRENLAETAAIARAEEEYWSAEVARVLPQLCTQVGRSVCLQTPLLASLPLALRRRVVRAAAAGVDLHLEFRHVEEILGLLAASQGRTGLPGNFCAALRSGALYLEPAGASSSASEEYAYTLPVPGRIPVPPLRLCIEARMVPAEPRNAAGASGEASYNPEQLLDPALLTRELQIRNWRAGDRFWPAHTKAPKKIKELLQERRISGPQRQLWPVAVCGEEIVWVRGFPSPAHFRPQPGARQGLLIQETVQEANSTS